MKPEGIFDEYKLSIHSVHHRRALTTKGSTSPESSHEKVIPKFDWSAFCGDRCHWPCWIWHPLELSGSASRPHSHCDLPIGVNGGCSASSPSSAFLISNTCSRRKRTCSTWNRFRSPCWRDHNTNDHNSRIHRTRTCRISKANCSSSSGQFCSKDSSPRARIAESKTKAGSITEVIQKDGRRII